MRKKTFLIALITALVFISCGAAVLFDRVIKGLDTSAPQSTVSLYDGWKIGVYEEKLALFKGNTQEPVEVYETPVSALREYDRELISNGFYTYDYDVAIKYIEELTS